MSDCRTDGCEGEIELSLNDLCTTVICPVCGAGYEVEFEENWDSYQIWLGAQISPPQPGLLEALKVARDTLETLPPLPPGA